MKRLSEIAVSKEYIARLVASGRIRIAPPLTEVERTALLHRQKPSRNKMKTTVDKSTKL